VWHIARQFALKGACGGFENFPKNALEIEDSSCLKPFWRNLGTEESIV